MRRKRKLARRVRRKQSNAEESVHGMVESDLYENINMMVWNILEASKVVHSWTVRRLEEPGTERREHLVSTSCSSFPIRPVPYSAHSRIQSYQNPPHPTMTLPTYSITQTSPLVPPFCISFFRCSTLSTYPPYIPSHQPIPHLRPYI
jgi:hypothetical protein